MLLILTVNCQLSTVNYQLSTKKIGGIILTYQLKQGVEFSHNILKDHLKKGDLVVDATVGNGYDTNFLAELVGEQGQVWGFDIQEKALQNTMQRLKENDLAEIVELIKASHEKMGNYIKDKVAGILFNLGYLPGGKKDLTTRAETTLQAVKEGLDLLEAGGLLLLVIYTGHHQGQRERDALIDYAKELDYKAYNVLHYHFINQAKKPPQVIAIKKRD